MFFIVFERLINLSFSQSKNSQEVSDHIKSKTGKCLLMKKSFKMDSLKDLKITLCQDFMANINLNDSFFGVHINLT